MAISEEKTSALLREMIHGHTNLNTWAAVVAILEAGLMYGPTDRHQTDVQKVIAIARRQQTKNYNRYATALRKITGG